MSAQFFKTPQEFRVWLMKNYQSEKELIVGYYKVKSGKKSMTWSESVDQALCFGWIDGVRRSLGEDSYCIRFTPRRQNSIWSAVNIKKMAELEKQNLLLPEGKTIFDNRKANSSDVYAYEKMPVEFSAEFQDLFQQNPKAWLYFSAQAPWYQKQMKHHVMGAKQRATRERRLNKLIETSEPNTRLV